MLRHSLRFPVFPKSCRSLSALGVAWRFHTENAPVDPPVVRDNRSTQGGHDHCTHQSRRRPLAHSIRFGGRAYCRRSGGALSQGACRGSLQAPDEGGLSVAGGEIRAAGVGQARDRGGGTRAHRDAALRTLRDALSGEPDPRGGPKDVQLGRSLGPAQGRGEPLPVRAEVQGEEARAGS